jgi:ABC-type phosphate transport system substrate-binding protein
MRTWPVIGLVPALALAALSAASSAETPSSAYRIIVNPNNAVTSVDRRFLEDAFLKKIKSWPDGETIHPVDLAANSPVRQRWNDDVLRRPMAALRAYWQQRIFSGRELPPPEQDSDAAVIKYVMRYEGGIGYVSATAPQGGAKTVALR